MIFISQQLVLRARCKSLYALGFLPHLEDYLHLIYTPGAFMPDKLACKDQLPMVNIINLLKIQNSSLTESTRIDDVGSNQHF